MDPKQYAQKKDSWCGPAALAWALAEQGEDVSQEALARESHTTEADGVDPSPLATVARHHNMQTHVMSGEDPEKTLKLLENYRDTGWSIILDYLAGDNLKQDGHYIALLDVNKYGLLVFNPANGGAEEHRDRENFIAHWKDTKKNGEKFRYYALLLKRRGGGTYGKDRDEDESQGDS